MPTITAGTVATVYCPLAGTITVTPGTSGRVSFQSRSQTGGQSAAPREIYIAETITVAAGDTLTMEAINVDATYIEPAGLDGSLQALVSEAGIQTWANRQLALDAGLTRCFFTDVGIGGSYWDYLGGRWRPQARSVTLRNLVSSISHNSSAKIVISEATLPAGLLQDGDVLAVDYLKTKEGGTSDTEATDLLLGATSGTLGTSLALTTSALATTTQQVASRYLYRRESATTIRPISITGPQGVGSSSGAPAGVITVPNMDSQATYLQISGDMTTGGGAETVWLRGFMVTLLAGA